MKTIILSIILFSTISLSVNGQSYYPMLGDTNTWYYYHCFEGCYTDIYCTNGDTVIGGLNYKVIGYCDMQTWGAFFREDTIEKKVYQRYNQNVELLMYDFSLQVGDSILLQDYFYNSVTNIGWYHLDSIKLVNISVGNRKSFNFHNTFNNNPLLWIEGVGTLGYPFQSYSNYAPSWDEVSCFYRNDTLIYQSQFSQQSGTCNIWVSINENESNSFELFPNPTTNEIVVSNSTMFKNYKLYDLLGKTLMSNDICENNFIIDLKSLPSGIYLLKLTDNNRSLTKKIIKN